jgi:hypothetical protein
MGTPLQLRRDSDAILDAYTGPAGELVISTTDWRPRVQDGATVSGRKLALLSGDTILHATGTNTAPGISFVGDPNTGMYSPAADQIAFATNGTQRMLIDNSGFMRLVSGNILLGASGSGSLALGATYVQLKSDDGANRIQLGKLGTDNRIFFELYDAAGGSSVVVRDNGGTTQIGLLSNGRIQITGTQVIGARRTGWTAPTGTATRTGFATSTATLTQVAEALKALIDDLHGTAGHGLVGT